MNQISLNHLQSLGITYQQQLSGMLEKICSNKKRENERRVKENQELLATSTLIEFNHQLELVDHKDFRMNRRAYAKSSVHRYEAWQEESQPKPLKKSVNHLSSNARFEQILKRSRREKTKKGFQVKQPKLVDLTQSMEQRKESKIGLPVRSRCLISNVQQQQKLYLRRFRQKERVYISSQVMPQPSFELRRQEQGNLVLKNKESSAIKKIKCGIMQKFNEKSTLNVSAPYFSFEIAESGEGKKTLLRQTGISWHLQNQRAERVMEELATSTGGGRLKLNKTEGGEVNNVNSEGFMRVDNRKEYFGKSLKRSNEFRMLINLLEKQK